MRDLAFDDCNDLIVVDDLQLVDDEPELLQALRSRLRFIQGEWYFDFTIGVPWLTGMFDPRVPNSQKVAYLKREILNTQGVELVRGIELNVDNQTKGALVRFTAETIYGTIEGGL